MPHYRRPMNLPHDANEEFQRIDFSALKWPAKTPCIIIYTSGTTGLPKVKHSRNVVKCIVLTTLPM